VRVKSYTEAVRLARSAGEDAANRRMRKAGRKAWSDADLEHASRVTRTLLSDLGFDVEGWTALAGVPRNEPELPAKPNKQRRRRVREPVQLCFAFA
jgi:hypothetical protein